MWIRPGGSGSWVSRTTIWLISSRARESFESTTWSLARARTTWWWTGAECHQGEALNHPTGRLEITGLPGLYLPGQTYALTVRLQRPGLVIGGFQLAVRDLSGRQAGELGSAEPGVRLLTAPNGVVYASHSLSGISAAKGVLRWRLTWQAPAAGGPVIVHAAGKAANDDASPLGDYIYATTRRARGASEK